MPTRTHQPPGRPPGHWPLMLPSLHLGTPGGDLRFHGVIQQTWFKPQRPAYADFLLVDGDLEGAALSLNDDGANWRILDEVPARLYAFPALPRVRHKRRALQILWPTGQPLMHRLAHPRGGQWMLLPCSPISIRWSNVKAQPRLQALLLCRSLTDRELDALR